MKEYDGKDGREGARGVTGVYERVVLVGNPNVGKSVIFGLLTGKYATVSNYPGTTVEVTTGNLSLGGRKCVLIDTPGVNSLVPMSEEEQVTRDILLQQKPTFVLQVADSKNLKRALFITSQLAEMELPVVLVLNMEDEARDLGINIDAVALQSAVGSHVVSTVAPERKGFGELKSILQKKSKRVPRTIVTYPSEIEKAAEKISALLPDGAVPKRSIALAFLSSEECLPGWLGRTISSEVAAQIKSIRDECQAAYGKPLGAVINELRLREAAALADRVTKVVPRTRSSVSEAVGWLCMHPLLGIPILLAILLGLYWFVGLLGAGTLVGLVEEKFFGELLNPILIALAERFIPWGILRDLLVGEYGLITMAVTYAIGIILPVTTTFFIAFSVLEDTGYLPRLAVMSNRMFNLFGLSGKAVLPMVLGLGCGTMAVLTTRILESKRDKLIATFLLALAVPCGAQLGVIMGMLGALSAAALLIWLGSVLGVMFLIGFLASRVLPGRRSEFILELPPMRLPRLQNVGAKTLSRVVWYLKEAVPIFIYGTFLLFLLDRLGLLAYIEEGFSPVVERILGLPSKAAEAFLIGFLRRDYGAAGLFTMAENGLLDPIQSVVSLVTVTLFVPCLAHFLMIVKERGLRVALAMSAVILPTAIGFGGLLNLVLRLVGVEL